MSESSVSTIAHTIGNSLNNGLLIITLLPFAVLAQ